MKRSCRIIGVCCVRGIFLFVVGEDNSEGETKAGIKREKEKEGRAE